jgi:hypothetical protein
MRELTLALPGQMPLDCTTCDNMNVVAAVAEDSMAGVVGSSILVGILTGMALNLVFVLINTIQLYVYLPLFDINFPGNI